MNYDFLAVVCTDSGTILPLSSCYLVSVANVPDDYGDNDAATIEHAFDHGKPLAAELGL
mgnify:FL=1